MTYRVTVHGTKSKMLTHFLCYLTSHKKDVSGNPLFGGKMCCSLVNTSNFDFGISAVAKIAKTAAGSSEKKP